MSISDAEFDKYIEDRNYKITCWTMPSYEITLSKINPARYDLIILQDSLDIYSNEKGIKFQIHYDEIQRIVALYFYNGTRGWYLQNTDIFVLDDINNGVARLINTRFEMMKSVFDKSMMDEDALAEYYNLNTKHYYSIKDDIADPNVKHIYLVPKKVWNLSKEFSELNQSEYKFIEDAGLHFANVHRAVLDVSKMTVPAIEKVLIKNGINKNSDFDSYVNVKHIVEFNPPKQIVATQPTPSETEEESTCEDCEDCSCGTNKYMTADFETEEFEGLDTSDYLFEINNGLVCVCPKVFWVATKCLNDFSFEFPHQDLITSGELSDGVWEIVDNTSEADLKNLMLTLGFEQDVEFSAEVIERTKNYT